MQDPIPPPPAFLVKLITPIAEKLALPTLPLHIHEVIAGALFYHVVGAYGAPWFSRKFFPKTYNSLSLKTKLNWDVHIVSFVQSSIVNVLALWVMFNDDSRNSMDARQRVFGYTGGCGMIQAFAASYFVWDLIITLQHMDIYGPGMLAHAVSALGVFSLGFRPFVNFYAPTFILYELSSPALNLHWFFDKLGMTGGTMQLVNGIVLLITFFSCRLVWGTYQSVRVYQDVYKALTTPGRTTVTHTGVMAYAGDEVVPLWLAIVYLTSNIVLNGLNFFWFTKMIEAIRKRFSPAPAGKKAMVATPQKGITNVKVEKDGDHTIVTAEETLRRRVGHKLEEDDEDEEFSEEDLVLLGKVLDEIPPVQ